MIERRHLVLVGAMALLGVGVVMVRSAGLRVGAGGAAWTDAQLRTIIYAALAVGAMGVTSRVNLRRWLLRRGPGNPLWLIVLASLVLTGLTLVPSIGRSVNGASRWLAVGAGPLRVTFQPSELIKWSMVLAVAWWGARMGWRMRRFTDGLLPMGALLAIGCGLVVIEDLGTAVLIAAVVGVMLLAAGVRWWQLGGVAGLASGAFAALIATSPYRVDRLTAFMDPWADPAGTGYHPIQSMLAIAQGGLTGRGLGNGIQKFGYLPEDTTDFIFAIVCEELGLAGAVLVVALYALILLAGLEIVRRAPDAFGRLLALGILVTVGLQAAINLAVVTVTVPTKGIALPLISSGGTGWIMTAAMLGLLAGLDEPDEVRLMEGEDIDRDEPRAAAAA